MGKTRIVGTIVGVFDGALDGVQARLIRRIQIGYTVELLESKGEFHKGDRVPDIEQPLPGRNLIYLAYFLSKELENLSS